MASYYKRGRIYWVKYKDEAGLTQRESLKTTSKQMAKVLIHPYQEAENNGTNPKLPGNTPIADVLRAYIRHILTAKSDKTAQNEFYVLRETFGPAMKGIQIGPRQGRTSSSRRSQQRSRQHISAECFEKITTADLTDWHDEQALVRKWKPKTCNNYRQVLVRLFNWAKESYDIILPEGKNPAKGLVHRKNNGSAIRYLKPEQINIQLKKLAEATRFPQLLPMVAMLIFAGLRRSELLWLQEDDIDLSAGQYGMISIYNKEVDDQGWTTKTGLNRAVPISNILRRYLVSYNSWENKTGKVTSKKYRPAKNRPVKIKQNWLFPSYHGNRWDPNNFSDELKKVNREKTIKTPALPWTSLDFRHTFGSQLAKANVSLLKISTLMGNSPEICRKHYAHLVPEEMADCVEFTGMPQISITDPTNEANQPHIIRASDGAPSDHAQPFQLRLIVGGKQ